jgi:hypothetical protein
VPAHIDRLGGLALGHLRGEEPREIAVVVVIVERALSRRRRQSDRASWVGVRFATI